MREGFIPLGLPCSNCGKQIAGKRKANRSGVSISGIIPMEYIHIETQISTCTRVYDACPYDVFAATRALEEATKAADAALAE